MKKIYLPSMIFALAAGVFGTLSLSPSPTYGSAASDGAAAGAAAGRANAEALYSPEESEEEESAGSCG